MPALLLAFPVLAAGKAHSHSPKDGELVGPHPSLTFLVDDYKPTLRFTVEISRDKFKQQGQSWDMRNSLRDWLVYDEEDGRGATLLVRDNLAEGTWWWRVIVHDGAADSGPDFISSFKVDATPPAEVEGLKVTYDRATGSAKLKWDPVSLDLEGRAETISLYRVYCYDKRGIFPQGNLKLLGTSETESFVDPKGPQSPTPIAYYRVTAVDSVGNETAAWKDAPIAAKQPEKKRPPGERGRRRRPGSTNVAPTSPAPQ